MDKFFKILDGGIVSFKSEELALAALAERNAEVPQFAGRRAYLGDSRAADYRLRVQRAKTARYLEI